MQVTHQTVSLVAGCSNAANLNAAATDDAARQAERGDVDSFGAAPSDGERWDGLG